MSFLDKIIQSTQQRVDQLYNQQPLEKWQDQAAQITYTGQFHQALQSEPLSLIAEVKKASPSKGIIRHDFHPTELATEFEALGASALSVLTEPDYFLGSSEFIAPIRQHVSLPILRKDFIIDEVQIFESKHMGVDAILLIQAILTPDQCQRFYSLARHIGLDVLIEVHNQDELTDVMSIQDLQMIGINNRNLTTFEVSTQTVLDLSNIIQNQSKHPITVIAESGYTQAQELAVLSDHRIHGVLIGEGLATHPELAGYFSSSKTH